MSDIQQPVPPGKLEDEDGQIWLVPVQPKRVRRPRGEVEAMVNRTAAFIAKTKRAASEKEKAK